LILPTKNIDQSLGLYFLLDDGRLEASLPGVDSLEATIDASVESSEPGVYGISLILLLVSFPFALGEGYVAFFLCV